MVMHVQRLLVDVSTSFFVGVCVCVCACVFCLNWCRMFSINSIDKFTTCHGYVYIQGSPAWNPGFLIGLPRCHSVALLLWLPFASKH